MYGPALQAIRSLSTITIKEKTPNTYSHQVIDRYIIDFSALSQLLSQLFVYNQNKFLFSYIISVADRFMIEQSLYKV